MALDVFLSQDSGDYDIVYRVFTVLDRLKISAYVYGRYPDHGECLPEVIGSPNGRSPAIRWPQPPRLDRRTLTFKTVAALRKPVES